MKEQLDSKQKEIVKLQAKIKILNNSNISLNNGNNNSLIRTKANSSLITTSKDDLDYNNKYKLEELYLLYRDNPYNDSNLYSYKNKTMSNIKSSRNNNFFVMVNKQAAKNKNNMSIPNNLNNFIKNFSSNSLRKKSTNNSKKKNVINSNRKNKNLKQTIHNSNSLNITNNTYNMSKNNIMINLNPKNTNMNLEKLKVEKKLYEYQKLIDKKLNELVKKRNPKTRKDKQYSMYVRRNSSPNIYINNNSQRKKNNNSLLGLENFLRKLKKKNATPNYNFNNVENNNSSISRKIMSNSAIEVIKKKKINKRNSNKSQKMKENKNSSENILNLKQNLNKGSFLSKTKDLSGSKQEFTNDSIIVNGKTNLSLRKYIFSKCCNNQTSNEIK